MRKLNIYHRKDGRYEGRISKGKQKNGKRSFLYFFGKTKADVERKMALASEAVNCNEKCGLTIAEVFVILPSDPVRRSLQHRPVLIQVINPELY